MKYAICNELFEGWEFADVCKTAAELGYRGVEIAPFTLAPLVTEITTDRRRQLRKIASDHGIEIIGLHWLFAKTEGFLATSTDPVVRARTATYLESLAECCADLGGDLLVFGSPPARKMPPGVSKESAEANFIDTIKRAMPTLERTKVLLLLEPLGPVETDFMNTAADAERMITELGSPLVRLHLDVKAMSTETSPIPDIIREHSDSMRHFHANDPNKRGPGMGEVQFEPIFAALRDVNYSGWVSVEVFDFTPDPITIARESIEYMRKVAGRVA